MHTEDPRRANRKQLDLPCELVVDGWDSPVGHSMLDASAYGAWLRSSFPGEVGDYVVCCFQPPGWERRRELMVFAEVKRILRPERGQLRRGMALEFLDITLNEQIALQRCLSPLCSRAVALSN